MDDLDIKIHSNGCISIKDLTHDVDISEAKWDQIFNLASEDAEVIYFSARRSNYINDELSSLINNLSQEALFQQATKLNQILVALKPIAMMFNRRQLAKLWQYYDRPAIVMVKDKSNESIIIENFIKNRYYNELLVQIDGIVIYYWGIEPNVLWIQYSD